ncbi:hypothetical protein [Microbacterium sp. NPDC056736]|uniref:hypothetical protein n=1 Tax=Microbacterium sp. NPDC056736 TaxID=3345932 RepID=UPI003670DEC5
MRKSLACAVVAIGLVLGSGGAAMAGEVNGNGDPIPGAGNASSECAFSGQDTIDSIENPMDSPFYNPAFDDDMLAERGNQKNGYKGVQSFGIFMKGPGVNAHVAGFNPGMACRGNMEAPPEG